MKYVHLGAEVSAISDKFVPSNNEHFNKTSVFPVNNVVVMSATKNKGHVNKQIYINVMKNNVQFDILVIVEIKLISDVILGIDFLFNINSVINTRKLTISCVINYKAYLYLIKNLI